MSDDAPPYCAPLTSPGVDPELVDAVAQDVEDVASALEGARNTLLGLVELLRRQVAQARKEVTE